MPPQPFNTASSPIHTNTHTLYATENNNFPMLFFFLETHYLPFIRNYVPAIGLVSNNSAPYVFKSPPPLPRIHAPNILKIHISPSSFPDYLTLLWSRNPTFYEPHITPTLPPASHQLHTCTLQPSCTQPYMHVFSF